MAAESLLQKLDDLEARFHEVSLLITDPAVIAYTPIFPDDGRGTNGSVQIKFCVYFQIYS